MKTPYIVKRLDETAPVDCPCGRATRMLTAADNDLVSIHRVRICHEAKKHYHTRLTEYYVILSGTGEVELDDDRVPVSAGDAIMIPPGTAHVARGQFEIINVVCPPFDPEDEHLLESG